MNSEVQRTEADNRLTVAHMAVDLDLRDAPHTRALVSMLVRSAKVYGAMHADQIESGHEEWHREFAVIVRDYGAATDFSRATRPMETR